MQGGNRPCNIVRGQTACEDYRPFQFLRHARPVKGTAGPARDILLPGVQQEAAGIGIAGGVLTNVKVRMYPDGLDVGKFKAVAVLR